MSEREAPISSICVGDGPSPLELTPQTEDLVRWAAVADDYTMFHLDVDEAQRCGFDGPVVHGTLQAAHLARMVQVWLGSHAELLELYCRYEEPAIVGRLFRYCCTVSAVAVIGGLEEIEFDLVVESPPGHRVTSGTAKARLNPSDGR